MWQVMLGQDADKYNCLSTFPNRVNMHIWKINKSVKYEIYL